MTLAISNIVTAFDEITIGTKVINGLRFTITLTDILKTFKFPANGQGFIPLPCLDIVSCGVAKRADITIFDYVVRLHRGEVCLFAKRHFAAKCESLAAIVYTAAAYMAAPQVSKEEIDRIWGRKGEGADFVLVAVLASAGPQKPPVSSHRFVRNLAGGNNSYKPENGYSIEKAIAETAAIVAYEQEWITVAD